MAPRSLRREAGRRACPICYSRARATSGDRRRRTRREGQGRVSGSRELDAYAVLGVDPASDDETVAAAYRALARRLHPDVAGDGATHQMSVVNAAFDRVRDPRRRREYDDELQEIDPARAARARSRPRGGRVRSRTTTAAPQQPKEPEHHRAPSPYHEFDDSSGRDGTGGAGRPPGRPSGQRSHVRAAHRLVDRRDRPGGPGLSDLARGAPRGAAVPRGDRRDAAPHRLPRGPPPAPEEAPLTD